MVLGYFFLKTLYSSWVSTKQTCHVEGIHETLLDEQAISQTYCSCAENGYKKQKESINKLRNQ